MTSGPPANAGEAAKTRARRSDAAPETLLLRMGAARDRPSADGAEQERAERRGIYRAVLRVEHALFVRTERAAVDAGVREESGVVVAVHGDAVAHAELAVTKTDGRPETGHARLRIEE